MPLGGASSTVYANTHCERVKKMIKVEISEEEYVALGVLRALGTSVVEAAMLARDALDCVGGRVAKARAVLSGVFSTAVKQGWCDANPVASVPVPEVKEREIHPLRREEVEALERTAEMPEHAGMQLSLHLMLYCGIRPTEVSRINPERDIDWQRGLVLVRPAVSKTGGGRVVPLRNAGWGGQGNPWVPDVCRHTFASYHAAYYRDLPALQVEMGHRDCSLLRTLYIMACLGMEPDWYWERGGGKSANPLTNA